MDLVSVALWCEQANKLMF